MIEDFAVPSAEQDADPNLQQDRLYFFQFPNPFPTFTEKGAAPPSQTKTPKKVSFAVKSEGESVSAAPVPDEPAQIIDGMIGHLQVYSSGAVKIQLVNGTLLDVGLCSTLSCMKNGTDTRIGHSRYAALFPPASRSPRLEGTPNVCSWRSQQAFRRFSRCRQPPPSYGASRKEAKNGY